MIEPVVEDDPRSTRAIAGHDRESTCAIVENDPGSPRPAFLGREQKYGEAFKQRLDEDQASDVLGATLDIDEVMRDIDAFNAIVEKWLL